MEASAINAIIAASAAILGGFIAATASLLNTRHKLKEMELAASQKLRENYLQNAREYTKGIYVPLSLSVSRLYDAFGTYQISIAAPSARPAFASSVEVFLAEVRRLRDSGAEAFLTNELEDRLRHFCEFLLASLTASAVVRRAVIGYRVGYGGLAVADSSELILKGKNALWWRSPKLSVSFLGMGLTYEAQVILAAPIDSVEFNQHLVSTSSEIRILVKEVTLGGKR